MAKKAFSTQSLVNTFPNWSNVRSDEQSLGYQYFNPIGNRLDDLRKQNIRIGDNYFLPTSIVSDIDVYYSYRLPGTYTFTKEDDDDTELLYTAPTVYGTIDDTTYTLTIASENDIESFWYDAIPDRWSLGAVASGEHLIASGLVNASPINPLTISGITHIPNQLYVTMSGGTSFLGLQDNGQVRRGIVQVEGITRAGLEVTEELFFVHDETIATQYEYKSLVASGLRVYGVNPTTTDVKLTSALFNEPDYPAAYDLAVDSFTNENMPVFWSVTNGYQAGVHLLSLDGYANGLELRLEGFNTKNPIVQQELLSSSGVNITPTDLAVETRSNNIWVVDSDTLYLFDANLPYASTFSGLADKDYDAAAIIEPDSYYATIGETVQIHYFWKLPAKGLVRHRVWVQKPDGTKWHINDGDEVAWMGDGAWSYGEPYHRELRVPDVFTLDQRGQYIYTLETKYTDGTTSIDQRIISVNSKDARAEWSLNSISDNLRGVDVDSEGKIWVMDNNRIKYQIDLHYDNMIIDFDKKIIYFREPYDKITVSSI